jgi:hypothetical protein
MLLLVSVPYNTRLPETLSLALHQFTASNVLKGAKTKEEMINAMDEVAKYPGNSLHDHDYHGVLTRKVMYVITVMQLYQCITFFKFLSSPAKCSRHMTFSFLSS